VTELTTITTKGGARFAQRDLSRFYRYCSPEPNSRCWLWTGAIAENGYGRFSLRGKSAKAHRFAYVALKGAIPDGACVLHSCDMPCCANPAHLSVGTNKDNTQDMLRKRRNKYETRRGSENKWTKLSSEQVADIRQRKGVARVYATKYGVSLGCIYAIWLGVSWKEAA
jgi:hypothetical protein